MLSTPWRGIRQIEFTGCQLYVDEGACVRFEYEVSGGLLLGVEILSSRWYFTDPGPTLRVYESSPATGARPGSTLVRCTRAAVDSDSFEAEDDATLEQTGEWTTVRTSRTRSRRPCRWRETRASSSRSTAGGTLQRGAQRVLPRGGLIAPAACVDCVIDPKPAKWASGVRH